jgi:glycosyltransferase involved in cell wall biosynthesis
MEKSIGQELVSICIPAFNAEAFISKTMACLAEQTYQNKEIIVVDDHSTDNTFKTLNYFAHNFPFVKVIKAQKKGAAAARNQAFKESSGNYIIFFDADDLVDPDFVEKQVDKIKNHKNAVVIANWGRFFNNDLSTYKEDHHIIKKKLSYKEWILGYWRNVRHHTPPGRLIFSRQLIAKTNLWDEELTLNDDFQFYNELFFHCDSIIHNDVNFYYRSGFDSLSGKKTERHYLSSFKSLKAGISLALLKYSNNAEVKLCCANMYQNLLFEIYPQFEGLAAQVKDELKLLPTPDFKYPCGGFSKIATKMIGWKLTKKLKRIIS